MAPLRVVAMSPESRDPQPAEAARSHRVHSPLAPSAAKLRHDFAAAVGACQAALARRPAGLLTDVDGTISPIALDPKAAIVLPGAQEALGTLVGRIEFVGVLSGRRAEDARVMVGVEGVEYFGVHGMVHWTPEGTLVHAEAAEFVTLMNDAAREVSERLAIPGMLIEPKGPVLAIHYRQTVDPAAARLQILRELNTTTKEFGLAVAEGRMVAELRPPPPFGKGWLVEDLADELGLAGLVYLGDDRTDMEAFHAIRTWREAAPDRQGVALAVASPEMPPALVEAADYVLDDVPAVELLLKQLAHPDRARSPGWV
jgi:trehalose 6-phosphate phosphatase